MAKFVYYRCYIWLCRCNISRPAEHNFVKFDVGGGGILTLEVKNYMHVWVQLGSMFLVFMGSENMSNKGGTEHNEAPFLISYTILPLCRFSV